MIAILFLQLSVRDDATSYGWLFVKFRIWLFLVRFAEMLQFWLQSERYIPATRKENRLCSLWGANWNLRNIWQSECRASWEINTCSMGFRRLYVKSSKQRWPRKVWEAIDGPSCHVNETKGASRYIKGALNGLTEVMGAATNVECCPVMYGAFSCVQVCRRATFMKW